MSARPAPNSRLFSLLRDEHGYSAAEKALAAVLALGLILMVTRVLLGGASTAADTVQQTLEGQSVGVNWSDGPEGGSGLPGGGSGPSGNIGDVGAGADDDSGGFWGTVATISHVVLGIGTMIPFVGTACALVDAGIYTAQGDYVNAIISVAAAVPFEGDVVEAARGTEQIIVGTAEVVESVNAGEKAVKLAEETREVEQAVEAEQIASKVVDKKPHANKVDDRPATLYEKYDKDGNFEKHGITKHEDPTKRYTKKQIDGGEVRPIERGPRREMLDKERARVETNPGPKNREPWAGKPKAK